MCERKKSYHNVCERKENVYARNKWITRNVQQHKSMRDIKTINSGVICLAANFLNHQENEKRKLQENAYKLATMCVKERSLFRNARV